MLTSFRKLSNAKTLDARLNPNIPARGTEALYLRTRVFLFEKMVFSFLFCFVQMIFLFQKACTERILYNTCNATPYCNPTSVVVPYMVGMDLYHAVLEGLSSLPASDVGELVCDHQFRMLVH
jgi:hypothetical protein